MIHATPKNKQNGRGSSSTWRCASLARPGIRRSAQTRSTVRASSSCPCFFITSASQRYGCGSGTSALTVESCMPNQRSRLAASNAERAEIESYRQSVKSIDWGHAHPDSTGPSNKHPMRLRERSTAPPKPRKYRKCSTPPIEAASSLRAMPNALTSRPPLHATSPVMCAPPNDTTPTDLNPLSKNTSPEISTRSAYKTT